MFGKKWTPSMIGVMETSDGHKLPWRVVGNPTGKPIVVLTGGPGRGLKYSNWLWNLLNPKLWKIVLFEQRGGGAAEPAGSLRNNTTPHLIRDIEQLREMLRIDKWTVLGSGWGATLGIIYGKKHHEHVSELVLSHPPLFREEDVDWLFKHNNGISMLFPHEYAEFVSPIPEVERGSVLQAYYRRLISFRTMEELLRAPLEEDEVSNAVKGWSVWEYFTSGLPIPTLVTPRESRLRGKAMTPSEAEAFEQAWKLARIECHYFLFRAFLGKDQVLDGLEAVRKLKTFIVLGRLDLVLPPSTELAFRNAWPEAEIITVDCKLHSSLDPKSQYALQQVLADLAGCGCFFKFGKALQPS